MDNCNFFVEQLKWTMSRKELDLTVRELQRLQMHAPSTPKEW